MRRASLGVALVLFGVLSACGEDRPVPTRPSQQPNVPVPPGPTPPSQATLSSCRVEGPASVPPGESAQFRATARYSDGSSRDVTSLVQWSSADESVLSVIAGGMATARSIGEVELGATLGANCMPLPVVVLPSGRFVVLANVTEDQITAPILGVRVEVISGPTAGVAATTDWYGSAKLLGVHQDAEIRFSKDGYQPIVRSMHFASLRQSVRLQMLSSGRIDLAGKYRLTISSGSCAGDGSLPDAAKTRTYTARMWNAGLKIQVELSDASFVLNRCTIPGQPRCAAPTGNVFTGQTQARDARFTLVEFQPALDWYYDYGIYPDLAESLPGVGFLTISGNAVVTPTSDGFSGTLDGTFAIYDNLSVTPAPDQGRARASCRSDAHRFTLVR